LVAAVTLGDEGCVILKNSSPLGIKDATSLQFTANLMKMTKHFADAD